MSREIERVRESYRPESIKLLFIAEAPPSNPERFFYYEDVWEQDGLFLEMMKVLYQTDTLPPPTVRRNKRKYLERFKADGYYLIDASSESMPNGATTRQKVKIIKASLDDLRTKLKQLEEGGFLSKTTPIILIAAPVFTACLEAQALNGYNILNDKAVPSASSGQQGNFKRELSRLLVIADIEYRAS